jgi:hypothetical protein
VQREPDLAQLSELWSDVRGSPEGAELEAELAREVPNGHVLADLPVIAVAARKLRREIVYLLPDGRWAWVHLTWTTETDPRWPSTTIADSWEALVEELRDGGRA